MNITLLYEMRTNRVFIKFSFGAALIGFLCL
jgi:hypothetical protein